MTALDPLVVAVTVVTWGAAALLLRAAWPLRGACAMRRPAAATRSRVSTSVDRGATWPDRA